MISKIQKIHDMFSGDDATVLLVHLHLEHVLVILIFLLVLLVFLLALAEYAEQAGVTDIEPVVDAELPPPVPERRAVPTTLPPLASRSSGSPSTTARPSAAPHGAAARTRARPGNAPARSASARAPRNVAWSDH